MNTEDSVVDDGSDGKIVEDVSAVSPYIQRPKFPQALIIESINLGDLPALVIPSNESDHIWVPDFVGKE